MKVNVLLSIDSKHPDFELFSLAAEKFKLNDQDRTILHISCGQVDFVGQFVRLEVCEPEDHQGLVLWIQSHHVLFAYGGTDGQRLGFLSS